jgi:hypothetical protein
MTQEKKPQLVHTARQMFETRLAKYNDPHNLEWDFDDIFDKWERHAWSAFLDLKSTEAERDALLNKIAELKTLYDRIFTIRSTGDREHPVRGIVDYDAKAAFDSALERLGKRRGYSNP